MLSKFVYVRILYIFQKSKNSQISQKQKIFEKNVSDKSFKVLKVLLNGYNSARVVCHDESLANPKPG